MELLGWMELALDDAPVLIVTSVNEGHLPSSVNSDAFLPNEARRALGLTDNRLRYARDAAWLTMILHSRPTVRLIGGRWDASGDPLRPSRLVLAVEPDRLADRVLLALGQRSVAVAPIQPPSALDSSCVASGAIGVKTSGGGQGEQGGVRGKLGPELEGELEGKLGGKLGGGGGWMVPYPQPVAPLEKLHVTAFRDYLACPYRFYLKHVLKLRPIPEPASELDPANFGTLAHQVLQMLAEDGLDACDQADRLADVLCDRLAKRMRERYGDPLPAALAIQQQQLQERLVAVARWQAEQAAMGWRIVEVEREIECPLSDHEPPFAVAGKIDRMDRHPVHGYRLIDYKTKDQPQTPEQVHGMRSGPDAKPTDCWVDLQLPLYVHLVRSIGIADLPKLGYLQMPRDVSQTDFIAAGWSPQEIEQGIERARWVMKQIQAGVFWPPTYPAPSYSEDWSGICQDRAMQRRLSRE